QTESNRYLAPWPGSVLANCIVRVNSACNVAKLLTEQKSEKSAVSLFLKITASEDGPLHLRFRPGLLPLLEFIVRIALRLALSDALLKLKDAMPAKHEKHLKRLRRICGPLPETTEKLSHGEPTFFCKKVFAMCSFNHHNDGHVAVVVPAPPGIQAMLIENEPGKY